MILWRLIDDWGDLPSGCCITEQQYANVYYLDRPLFEPIEEFEQLDMIEYKDEIFCIENNIVRVLFYTQSELEHFINQITDNGIID